MRWCMISFLEISDNHFDMKSELNWTVCYVIWFLISSQTRRDRTTKHAHAHRTREVEKGRGGGAYEQKRKARGGHTVDDDGEKEQI